MIYDVMVCTYTSGCIQLIQVGHDLESSGLAFVQVELGDKIIVGPFSAVYNMYRCHLTDGTEVLILPGIIQSYFEPTI